MKRVLVVSLALGMAVANIPSAVADSFGYRTIGSNNVAKFAIDANHASLGAIVSETGALPAQNGAQLSSGNGGQKANVSVKGNARGEAGKGSDNFLNRATSTKGLMDGGGALVDLSGSEVNLLLSAFSGAGSSSASANGHSVLGDKGGIRLNEGISRAGTGLAAGAATLAATPEPGSLFLLGTGLLCMALVLFRKGAKRPVES